MEYSEHIANPYAMITVIQESCDIAKMTARCA